MLEACPNPRNGLYTAPAARLAALAQQPPGMVMQELRQLAAGSVIGFELSRDEGQSYEVGGVRGRRLGRSSGRIRVSIRVCHWQVVGCSPAIPITPAPSQILRAPGNLDALAAQVHARLTAVLACQVSRLDTSYRALAAALEAGQGAAPGEAQEAQEAALRAAVEAYFDDPALQPAPAGADGADGGAAQLGSGSTTLLLDTGGLPLRRAEPALLQAARAVARRNREQAGPALSARALARILHGVSSPAFPPAWQKRMGAFWGSQTHIDFAAVLKAAEIVLRDDDE